MAPPSDKVARALYRSLLRTAKPFTSESVDAAVLTSLLHRSGIDDHIRHEPTLSTASDGNISLGVGSKQSNVSVGKPKDQARDLTKSYLEDPSGAHASEPKTSDHHRLFRRLLREVVSGDEYGCRLMTTPSQVDTRHLKEVIRREFRNGKSAGFDDATRRQVAFLALKELNKKLLYYEDAQRTSELPVENQAAWNVSPLSAEDPSEYLRPGAFLVSHPFLSSHAFKQTVICILKHEPEANDIDALIDGMSQELTEDDPNAHSISTDWDVKRRVAAARSGISGRTYGVIVNRINVNAATAKPRTLSETFEKNSLPTRFIDAFGEAFVREGGPLHPSFQMIYSCFPPTGKSTKKKKSKSKKKKTVTASPEDESLLNPDDPSVIGGTLIPAIPKDDESPAQYSDKATYFEGNMFKAIDAVEQGVIERDDISFLVGASIWESGRLEQEIEKGYWIPCRGPPEIAMSGICEHVSDQDDDLEKKTMENQLKDPDYKLEKSLSSGSNLRRRGPPKRRPLTDLWLSMISACGEGESKLAHLVYEKESDENNMVCDSFHD